MKKQEVLIIKSRSGQFIYDGRSEGETLKRKIRSKRKNKICTTLVLMDMIEYLL